jgi:ubiquinone/menaquinone biosynthesis C-methylase UbiE
MEREQMKYILESKNEFDRLEKQSKVDAYDFKRELRGFAPNPHGTLLDAGCGSGIVSRYLAKSYPEARIIGCDMSSDRIRQASEMGNSIENLSFREENLSGLSFKDATFDAIVCRYVVEHLAPESFAQTLREFKRCLKPGGQLMIIDVDGLIFNIYPLTSVLEKTFEKINRPGFPDLFVGRKIPLSLSQAGFSDLQWEVETLTFQGESLKIEAEMIRERFVQVRPVLVHAMGESEADQFIAEYLDILGREGTVLFYNKFAVSCMNGNPRLQLVK